MCICVCGLLLLRSSFFSLLYKTTFLKSCVSMLQKRFHHTLTERCAQNLNIARTDPQSSRLVLTLSLCTASRYGIGSKVLCLLQLAVIPSSAALSSRSALKLQAFVRAPYIGESISFLRVHARVLFSWVVFESYKEHRCWSLETYRRQGVLFLLLANIHMHMRHTVCMFPVII